METERMGAVNGGKGGGWQVEMEGQLRSENSRLKGDGGEKEVDFPGKRWG